MREPGAIPGLRRSGERERPPSPSRIRATGAALGLAAREATASRKRQPGARPRVRRPASALRATTRAELRPRGTADGAPVICRRTAGHGRLRACAIRGVPARAREERAMTGTESGTRRAGMQVRERNGEAVWFDPDPNSKSGRSVRVIGYSHSREAILTVILVRRDDGDGYWGANGWESTHPTGGGTRGANDGRQARGGDGAGRVRGRAGRADPGRGAGRTAGPVSCAVGAAAR